MIEVKTWEDVQKLTVHASRAVQTAVVLRFRQLWQFFGRETGCELAQFSLEAYGPLFVVESFEEIDGLIFESMEKQQHYGETVYLAVRARNNSECVDYIINAQLLDDQQLQQLEREL